MPFKTRPHVLDLQLHVIKLLFELFLFFIYRLKLGRICMNHFFENAPHPLKTRDALGGVKFWLKVYQRFMTSLLQKVRCL